MKKKIFVFRKLVAISDDTLKRMTAYAMDGNRVFNPDDLRLQRHIRKTHPFVKQTIMALMKKNLLKNRRVGSVVMMHSRTGCKRQAWHTDYDPQTLENAKTKPMGVIVALQAGTFFATSHKTYELGAGDVLCFQHRLRKGSSLLPQFSKVWFSPVCSSDQTDGVYLGSVWFETLFLRT